MYALPALEVRGSEPSAAGGRYSELSEWQRSTDGKALCRRSQMSGTATGNLSSCRPWMSSGHPQAEKSPDLSVEAHVFALPAFAARAIYRPAVRGCPVDIHRQKKAPTFRSRLLYLRYLFSQPVTRQLSSAYVCLTSVFGMGTGGPTRQSTQTHYWKRFSPSYIQPIYVDFCY